MKCSNTPTRSASEVLPRLRFGLFVVILVCCTLLAVPAGVSAAEPGIVNAGVFLPAIGMDSLLYNRRLTVQAAVIMIAVGIFMLRKKKYR